MASRKLAFLIVAFVTAAALPPQLRVVVAAGGGASGAASGAGGGASARAAGQLRSEADRIDARNSLVRGWNRRSQRVMVMSDGFAWNGQTMTASPRSPLRLPAPSGTDRAFFGLRGKGDRLAMDEARS